MKRRGRPIEELSIVEKPKIGRSRLLRVELIQPDSPITIHRRPLRVDSYGAEPREAWAKPPEEMPTPGTFPERVVYLALEKRHIAFDFQSSLTGGRLNLGGMVADFILTELRKQVIIRVQGEFWHGEFSWETGDLITGELVQGRNDDVQRGILEDMGYLVTDFWEHTADNPFSVDAWFAVHVDSLLFGVVQ